MTRYEFTVTIGASPVNLATAAVTAGAVPAGWVSAYPPGSGIQYLPACKLLLQLRAGATGPVYRGSSASMASDGTSGEEIDASQGGGVGGDDLIESQEDCNVIQLGGTWVHGPTAGDLVRVVYHQA